MCTENTYAMHTTATTDSLMFVGILNYDWSILLVNFVIF